MKWVEPINYCFDLVFCSHKLCYIGFCTDYVQEKKEAEERARQKRLEEGEEESKNHSRNIEANQFSELLLQKGFRMAEVLSDLNLLLFIA